ncbi:uncharacterized protein B0J16DRAFT_316704 [Fusarium flagelliforme]|nr:uncharacterized protein B0J16DRAFT_316704 [Fusarium flagelliforme]KAH7193026.1 hypothetical protein B0J16DRAFT_316704 [Fusarium flagelliforme]
MVSWTLPLQVTFAKRDNGMNYDPENFTGQVILNLNVALVVITSVFMLVRLYVRAIMTRGLGRDDVLATIAWCLITALSCIEVVLVTKGVGTHMDSLSRESLAELFSLMPVDKMLFISSGCFVRLSILFCLPRIYRDRSFMTCIYGVSLATVIVAATSLLFLVFSCSPPSDVFNAANPDRQCVSNYTLGRMRQAHSISASIVNVIILFLAIWASSTTARTRAKTIKRTLILIVGVFAIVSTFVRIGILLTTDLSVDTTYRMVRTAPWFPIEVHTGLWCGCLLAFEPLTQPSNDPRNYNNYNMRKLSRSSAWEPQDDLWHRNLVTSNPRISIHGMPRDAKGKRKASNAESEADIEMLENERGIKLTTEFSVHVENSAHAGERLEERVSRTPAWNAF